MSDEDAQGRWPALRVAEWQDTRDTLHLFTQVVGKVRLAHEPVLHHWWNVPLYVGARGFGTSLITPAHAPAFEMNFDVPDSVLRLTTVDGAEIELALEPRTVADFYAAVTAALDELGVATEIWSMPVEIDGAIPFDTDDVHHAYDAEAVRRFWLMCVQIQRVFGTFRARFVGKTSPVHLFWGALDLAVTRFSGRSAPPHPGGAPNCGPHVMWEAYSHEVSSAGFWPGGPGEEGTFYSYAYPEPEGYRDAPVGPTGARFDESLGEFVLPYEQVRTAPDPDAALLEFLQSTYEAAAVHARWDRAALERPAGQV
jgi:hypothetical protein